MAKTVKVYSAPTCPYCMKLKQFLKANNINFEDIDIAADPARGQEIMQKSGQIGVPMLDIDSEIIVGFDKERIEKALGL